MTSNDAHDWAHVYDVVYVWRGDRYHFAQCPNAGAARDAARDLVAAGWAASVEQVR